jgi:hypothetical protein
LVLFQPLGMSLHYLDAFVAYAGPEITDPFRIHREIDEIRRQRLVQCLTQVAKVAKAFGNLATLAPNLATLGPLLATLSSRVAKPYETGLNKTLRPRQAYAHRRSGAARRIRPVTAMTLCTHSSGAPRQTAYCGPKHSSGRCYTLFPPTSHCVYRMSRAGQSVYTLGNRCR